MNHINRTVTAYGQTVTLKPYMVELPDGSRVEAPPPPPDRYMKEFRNKPDLKYHDGTIIYPEGKNMRNLENFWKTVAIVFVIAFAIATIFGLLTSCTKPADISPINAPQAPARIEKGVLFTLNAEPFNRFDTNFFKYGINTPGPQPRLYADVVYYQRYKDSLNKYWPHLRADMDFVFGRHYVVDNYDNVLPYFYSIYRSYDSIPYWRRLLVDSVNVPSLISDAGWYNDTVKLLSRQEIILGYSRPRTDTAMYYYLQVPMMLNTEFNFIWKADTVVFGRGGQYRIRSYQNLNNVQIIHIPIRFTQGMIPTAGDMFINIGETLEMRTWIQFDPTNKPYPIWIRKFRW